MLIGHGEGRCANLHRALNMSCFLIELIMMVTLHICLYLQQACSDLNYKPGVLLLGNQEPYLDLVSSCVLSIDIPVHLIVYLQYT